MIYTKEKFVSVRKLYNQDPIQQYGNGDAGRE